MKDRVSGKPGRVKVTYDDGESVEVTLTRADQPVEEGTPLNKASLLSDAACDVLGLDRANSVPSDAFLAIPSYTDNAITDAITALGYAFITITALLVNGSPLPNVKVEGLTGVDANLAYTDSRGQIKLYVKEGTYSLSIPTAQCIDATMPVQKVTVSAGQKKTVVMRMITTGITSKTFTSSDTVKFSGNVASVDVFCVGGGGGGGFGAGSKARGGGGGGGRTATKLSVPFTALSTYQIIVGAGGSASNSGNSSGNAGGTSSCMGVSASGGNGGGSTGYSQNAPGGSGGSGGGSGGSGGEDGSDGNGTSPGSGQGGTTRAFGETNGTLCAGGGGSCGSSAGSGYYGQGGNGGGVQNLYNSSNGATGVVMIRWRNRA